MGPCRRKLIISDKVLNFQIDTYTRDTVIDLIVSEFTAIQSKNRRYSLRAHSRKLGLSPGALSELISGKRPLTFKTLFNVQQVLPRQCKLRQHISKILKGTSQATSERRTSAKGFFTLKEASFRTIAEWQHYAILSLSEVADFKSDPVWIARRLGISVILAKSSISRLLELGLMTHEQDGDNLTLRPSYKNLTTTSDIENRALRIAHVEDLERAKMSLDTLPLDLRDITSITFCLDTALLPEAKLFLKEWRRRFCAQFENRGSATEVYTLSLCLVPVTVPQREQSLNQTETSVF